MRSRKILPGERFRCARCPATGDAFPPGGGGSNYLVHRVRDGLCVKLCKDCAEKGDRADVTNGAPRMFGYLACHAGGIQRSHAFEGVHGRSLGVVCSVGGEVSRTRRGPFGVRHYLRVRMFDGSTWHGTGAPGMYCSLRRSKVHR